jgi:hypothetical protein
MKYVTSAKRKKGNMGKRGMPYVVSVLGQLPNDPLGVRKSQML